MYGDRFFRDKLASLYYFNIKRLLSIYGYDGRLFIHVPMEYVKIFNKQDTTGNVNVVDTTQNDVKYTRDEPFNADPMRQVYNQPAPPQTYDTTNETEDETIKPDTDLYIANQSYFLPYKIRYFYKEEGFDLKPLEQVAEIPQESTPLELVVSLEHTELMREVWQADNSTKYEPIINMPEKIGNIRPFDYIEIPPFGSLVDKSEYITKEFGRVNIFKYTSRFFRVIDIIPVMDKMFKNNFIFSVKAVFDRSVNHITIFPVVSSLDKRMHTSKYQDLTTTENW